MIYEEELHNLPGCTVNRMTLIKASWDRKLSGEISVPLRTPSSPDIINSQRLNNHCVGGRGV